MTREQLLAAHARWALLECAAWVGQRLGDTPLQAEERRALLAEVWRALLPRCPGAR